jgi:predicted PurR-regulated permease PerM
MAMAPKARLESQVSVVTVLTICWAVFGFGVAVTLAYLARVTLTLILAAGVFAIALHRLVDLLERHRVKKRLARALVLVGFFALLAGFFGLIIPAAVNQAKALMDAGPRIMEDVQRSVLFEHLDARFGLQAQFAHLQQRVAQVLEDSLAPALKAVGGVLSGLGGAVTFLFVMIFLLIYGEDLLRRLLAEATHSRRAKYELMLRKLYDSVGGYLSGLAAICGINAALTTTFLAIIRTPYFLPLGILSGFSSLVPYIGPLVTGALVSVLALLTGGVWHGLATAIYFIAYGQLEGNVLSPLIFRRTVHLNPLVVLLSVLIGADLAKVPGAVLAVPVAASAQILLQEALARRRRRLDVPLTGEVAAAQRGESEAGGDEGEPQQH